MKKGQMSAGHKKALAEGRRQSKAVRDYLAALEAGKRRGPKQDATTLQRKLDETTAAADAEEDPAKRVELIQRRLDLQERLGALDGGTDPAELEAGFVANAKAYSERKGISYTAWRELGVPASVLRDAGVARTRRTG